MYLAIYQFIKTALAYVDERGFGGIAYFAKHALAAKNIAYLYAVNTANQFLILPNLNGVGVTFGMQLVIGCFHIIGDPGAILSLARNGRACCDHLIETSIGSNAE